MIIVVFEAEKYKKRADATLLVRGNGERTRLRIRGKAHHEIFTLLKGLRRKG